MAFPIHVLKRCDDYLEDLKNITTFIDYIDVLDDGIIEKYHVSGRLYEYFLGFVTAKNKGKRGGTQIEELGQFFTSRVIIRYIIALLNPTLDENNNVPPMMDAFCGSGGFLIEYIKYLQFTNPDVKIDWNKNIENIHGYDTDMDICKSACVDILCLTKIFNIKQNCRNQFHFIKCISSTFTDNFIAKENVHDLINHGTHLRVKFNLTNPPYGGDKMDCKIGRPIRHILETGTVNKPYEASDKIILSANDKESLSMLHGMGVLDKDGVYAGVLKEGCIFGKAYTNIRRELINNYSIEYVISVPQNNFLNTMIKTSIVIYRNTGKKTDEIKFPISKFRMMLSKLTR